MSDKIAAIVPVTNEFEERQKKLKDLRESGILPYAERFERTHLINQVREFGEKKSPRTVEEILAEGPSGNNPNSAIKICGRIMLMRPHGKLTFAQIKDVSGQMQICLMQDFVSLQNMAPPEAYKLIGKKIDVGDFVGLTGELFVTKHGELTLLVREFQLLSKTLRPLPEKFHGLQDTEAKYRKRYLDLLSDKESFDRFIFRANLISRMRGFLDAHGFLEVETPVLASIASGATAKPFTTHHNALDIDMYLRIATETYLKRCVVGGYERVYEFGKCFRNEGMDPSHLQEFNMLEYYAAYWNYEDNMDFAEKLIVDAIKTLKGDLKVKCRDREGLEQVIDFTPPWPRLSFVDLIKGDCGIDILEYYGDADGIGGNAGQAVKTAGAAGKAGAGKAAGDTGHNDKKRADALRTAIKKRKIVIEKAETMGYGNLCDALYKKVSRPKLIQPAFVINHPVDTKPLARRNDKDPRIADTFQLLVNTWEIVNAYSELVDPMDQRERLERQAAAKDGGDEEAMPMDEDFILAMEHGMPPMSGFGMGIDRLTALLTNQDNLKDTVLFPIMRPRQEQSECPSQ